MTVAHDFPSRTSSHKTMSATCLEDRFEIIKDIGDGSFGSVALARVRSAGSNVARRGTMVSAISPSQFNLSMTNCVIGRNQNDEEDI